MKNLSIDLGASTIDVIEWEGAGYTLKGSFEYKRHFDIDLQYFLKEKGIKHHEYDEIFVTGGKSRGFSADEFTIVDEITAIGRGGAYLIRRDVQDDFVVVSMGTGTCIVHVKKGQIAHLGGTGIGGGTFLALSRELFGVTDIEQIKDLYKKGDPHKVDLSVKEVVGGAVGIVSEEVTASNLGKIARNIDFSKEDLAAGIVNLIGQTIATAACFAAKSVYSKKIVLSGKLSRISEIVEVIKNTAKVYGLDIFLPKDADYVSAIGAGAKAF